MLKSFILDPSLETVQIETWFQESGPRSLLVFEKPHTNNVKCCLRQALESSKGTWLELPLSELEKTHTSPEDKEWLQKEVVDSMGTQNIS